MEIQYTEILQPLEHSIEYSILSGHTAINPFLCAKFPRYKHLTYWWGHWGHPSTPPALVRLQFEICLSFVQGKYK